MRTRKMHAISVALLVVIASSMTLALGGMAKPVDSAATAGADATRQTQATQNETVLTIEELEIETLLLENGTVLNGTMPSVTLGNETETNRTERNVTFERATGTVRMDDVILENVTVRNDSLASELALDKTTGQLGDVSVHIATLSNRTIEGVHIERGSVENVVRTGVTLRNGTMNDTEAAADSVSPPPALEARTATVGTITLLNVTVVDLETEQPMEG